MKRTITLFVLLMIFGAVTLNAQSIKIPSTTDLSSLSLPTDKDQFEKHFLSALDPGTDSGNPADKLTKLVGGNKDWVGGIIGILGGKDDNDT